ncbi:MAG: hypothetical protein M1822_002287 [Bathelium mastoideum]|nr:MAG: hypothetical protein M1822_002287 [Bathelium mastoideum]
MFGGYIRVLALIVLGALAAQEASAGSSHVIRDNLPHMADTLTTIPSPASSSAAPLQSQEAAYYTTTPNGPTGEAFTVPVGSYVTTATITYSTVVTEIFSVSNDMYTQATVATGTNSPIVSIVTVASGSVFDVESAAAQTATVQSYAGDAEI